MLANLLRERALATRARGELLRGETQRTATVLDGEIGSVCSCLAGELRESVCGAAQVLIERVKSLVGKVETAADA